MSKYILDFEKELKVLDQKINDVRETSSNSNIDMDDTLSSLQFKFENKRKSIYKNLSRWEKIQISRHPLRPHAIDYIQNITSDFIEIHGDRKFKDDPSIITGIAIIDTIKCVIIGQEKGRSTKDKMYRNFGMVKPEGYRKALRVMLLAEKFKLPIITLIDTPGAYPGIGAEERGQSHAIAENLFSMSKLKTPIISIVIGEGASGGALAIGLSDKIFCLEYTWYSVISPEGCASILFKDTLKSEEAADSMKVTSKDLFEMNISDGIIDEPLGGAHHDPETTYKKVKNIIIEEINKLINIPLKDLINNRMDKYNSIGIIDENK